MESKTERLHRMRMEKARRNGTSFDVVCTVGTIVLDEDGSMSAYAAAFQMIGEHGGTGEYSFPNADGGTVRVSVAHDAPNAYDPV